MLCREATTADAPAIVATAWIAPGGRQVKTRRYARSRDELAVARKAW